MSIHEEFDPVNSITEFMKKKLVYEQRARERENDYLNSRHADATWPEKVMTEMCMDLLNRVESCEKLVKEYLTPPKEQTTEKPKEEKKAKFF